MRFAGMNVASKGVWAINCIVFKNIHMGRSRPPKPTKSIDMIITVIIISLKMSLTD